MMETRHREYKLASLTLKDSKSCLHTLSRFFSTQDFIRNHLSKVPESH